MPTNVVVIAPIRLHRESLAAALDARPNLTVVGEAATVQEALPQLQEVEPPSVALLNVPQPDDAGLPLPPAQEPQAKLVAVGAPPEEAAAWVEAGVSGFVPPDASVEDTAATLEQVASGEFAAPPEIAAHLAGRLRRLASDVPGAEDQLTAREREVLELVIEGLPNKEIARRLSIQEQTAKNHVHNILVKLGASGRSELASRTRASRRHWFDR